MYLDQNIQGGAPIGGGKMSRILCAAAMAAALLAGCGGGGGEPKESPEARDPASIPNGTIQVQGVVTGVMLPGLVLTLNGVGDTAVDIDRHFSFPVQLREGAAYTVAILTNPKGQHCRLMSGESGTATSKTPPATVSVQCREVTEGIVQVGGQTAYPLSGKVSGLKGKGLRIGLQTLSTSGVFDQIDLPVGTTDFTFPSPMRRYDSSRSLVIVRQPDGQSCKFLPHYTNEPTLPMTDLSVRCRDIPQPNGTTGLKLSTDQVLFEAEQGQAMANQSVMGTLFGLTEAASVYIAYTNRTLSYASVNYIGEYAAELILTARPNADFQPGTYTDTVTVSVCYDSLCKRHAPGSPRQITVTYKVLPPQAPTLLETSERGVAFAATTGASRLSKDIRIDDTSSEPSSWHASANAAWLSATSTGASGTTMKLTANPAGLADGFHEAAVTLTSDNPALKPSTVRVGLYVSHAASAMQLAESGIAEPPDDIYYSESGGGGVRPVVDPVRPYVYLPEASKLGVYNMHSGELLRLIDLGAPPGALSISDDGLEVYVQNGASGNIDVVDPRTLTITRSFTYLNATCGLKDGIRAFLFGRTGGVPMLIVQTNAPWPCAATPIIHATTGQTLGSANFDAMNAMGVSRNGKVLYFGLSGYSGVMFLHRSELKTNALGNVFAVHVAEVQGSGASSTTDIAVNHDGSRACYANRGMNDLKCTHFDGQNLVNDDGFNPTLAGRQPFSMEFDGYGRWIGLIYYDTSGISPLRWHADTGSETPWSSWTSIPTWTAVDSIPPRSLRVSGDGLRAVGRRLLLDLPQ